MKKRGDILTLVLLIVITVVVSFPLFVMISFSLRLRSDVFSTILWPANPTLDNYVTIFKDNLLMRYIYNSFLVAISATLLCVLTSIITGYGFSRFRFKGKEILFSLLFMTQMFPPILVGIGFFHVILKLGLYDTLFGLVLLNTASTLPFAIWMMKGYFDGISPSLDEAAMIDGCSRVGACFRVIIPLATPGTVATGIWTFITAWGEYLYAVTFTSSSANRLVTTGVVELLGHFVVQWGLIMAYALIISAPVLMIFVFLQNYFISGLTSGGLKE